MWNFYTVLLQIHSGNCLQKISILDLSLIKLLQNEQGCIFLPHSVDYVDVATRSSARERQTTVGWRKQAIFERKCVEISTTLWNKYEVTIND